jgi:AcrR family transcriptional regulator
MSDPVKSRAGRIFVPPPPPKTPKSARTRRRLLDIAADLFIERGYGTVSTRDIAAAAGLTHGALYGHFRSKGQLLVEVIRMKLADRDHSPAFRATVADPERGVDLMYDESGREIRVLEVDAAAAARHDPDVLAGLASLYQERHERIRDAMSGSGDPDTAAWLVAALTAGIGMKESSGLPRPDDDRLHDAVTAAMRGLTES